MLHMIVDTMCDIVTQRDAVSNILLPCSLLSILESCLAINRAHC
jgi:hypothetical protein